MYHDFPFDFLGDYSEFWLIWSIRGGFERSNLTKFNFAGRDPSLENAKFNAIKFKNQILLFQNTGSGE
ncbi:hypothetical protein [uncultured Campylobacter sp.]|uniref:hypothetical protein n=1 Tax=uncultured Campylobacter sp. TaxID=218934 RepID=UPI0028E70514|nr:hypothetical protein [uncultured Campylobacter sp.]